MPAAPYFLFALFLFALPKLVFSQSVTGKVSDEKAPHAIERAGLFCAMSAWDQDAAARVPERSFAKLIELLTKKQGAAGITTAAPHIAGQWGRGDNRLPE